MSAPFYNITIEENSDFNLSLSLTQFGMDISTLQDEALFKISKSFYSKTPIDLSAYVSVDEGMVTISVPAETIKTIPFTKGVYDIVVIVDSIHRKRALQGKVKILKAVSK